jgi:hypothetical protein
MPHYTVTDRAGRFVAGRRVVPGQELELTTAEAEHDLREGSLVPKGGQRSAAFDADSERLAAIRVRATGAEPAPPPAADQPEAADPPARRARTKGAE